MPAQIRVLSGPERERVFQLEGPGPIRIGRGKDAGIQINDPTVSRTHCEIAIEEDLYVLVDAQSRSGTFVNTEQVTQWPLRHGDTVQIGETRFRFELGTGREQPTLMVDPARSAGRAADPSS